MAPVYVLGVLVGPVVLWRLLVRRGTSSSEALACAIGFAVAGHFQATESYASLFIFATVGNFISIVIAMLTWKTLADRNTMLLYVTPTARIDPLVVADTTNGPVVIEAGAVVAAFTRLEGPCYVGPRTQLWLTPGHTDEDITLLVEADDAVYAMTHLWWHGDRTPEVDPFAFDQAVLDTHRERVLAAADIVIPGHGEPFRVRG